MEPYRTGHGDNGLQSPSSSSNASSSESQFCQGHFRNPNISQRIVDPAGTRHTPSRSSTNASTSAGRPSTQIEATPSYMNRTPTTHSYNSHNYHVQDSNLSSPSHSHMPSTEDSRNPTAPLKRPPQSTATSSIPRSAQLLSAYPRANMSTLGIQYDARFDAGMRPNSYTWPLFDMPEEYGTQVMTSSESYDVAMSSPEAVYASSSISPSPPQSIFTPEQREFKRQGDQTRNNPKQRIHRGKSNSSSFDVSQQSTPPDMITRSINSDAFTTSVPSMSLPAEDLMSMPAQSYMSGSPSSMPLTSSPAPIPGSRSPGLYGSQFSMLSNDFGAGFPTMQFSSASSEPSLTSYSSGRPHSSSAGAQDQPLFYQSQPFMTQESSDSIRVVHSRPKPQCWDHGCNGRQFSTFSNLLRHQREKSGIASKPTCPKCGAEFTRTTARNGHMAHEKCKQRRNS